MARDRLNKVGGPCFERRCLGNLGKVCQGMLGEFGSSALEMLTDFCGLLFFGRVFFQIERKPGALARIRIYTPGASNIARWKMGPD